MQCKMHIYGQNLRQCAADSRSKINKTGKVICIFYKSEHVTGGKQNNQKNLVGLDNLEVYRSKIVL